MTKWVWAITLEPMKDPILQALRHGNYVSGEEIGKAIGVSRTAVWKHINKLRHQGYRIDSSSRKGYSLVNITNSPLPEEIMEGLSTHTLGQHIQYYKEVESTQDIAKQLAAGGADEGTLVIAEKQSRGRGRMGRQWTSSPGGVYLSLILRPEIKPSEALWFPLIAGIAVAQAIRQLVGLQAKLKWPNDIFVGGKKAGGILIEMSAEIDRLDYVIVGMGINVNTRMKDFPQELKKIATSLRNECGQEISSVKLVQAILTILEHWYEDFSTSGFERIRQTWKEMSNTIGSLVSVNTREASIKGHALDIDHDGALIVQSTDGTPKRIIAGDITLRNLDEGNI